MLADDDTAILVHYELEGQMYAADGVTVVTERSNATKRIKVKTIGATTDIEGLAAEIVDKCKLIHHSKIPKVEGLLRDLRDREAGGGVRAPDQTPRRDGGAGTTTADAPPSSSAPAHPAPVVTKGVVRAVRGRKSFYDEHQPVAVVRGAPTAEAPANARRGTAPKPSSMSSISSPSSSSSIGSKRAGVGAAPAAAARPQPRDEDPTSPTLRQMERLAIAEDERVLRETTAGGASMDLAYANARVPSLANVKSHAEDLDDYLERLYDDDMNARVDATARIAALARRVENLPMLLGHDTLVQTLARVLREEGRKSVDLATNVVSVFFAFSNYSQFHPAILENQMGDATMRIVDLETKRHDDRLETIKEQGELDEFTERRLALAERKQDRLLYVCFYMLLNLSEDPSVERKMKKRNISVYLCKALERRSVDLLVLCVTFLKKLSVYRENKDAMKQCAVVDKLARFVPGQDVLLLATLRLLLNLSFDEDMRKSMVERALIPRVVDLMKNPHFQHVSMALLYHVSVDPGTRGMFAYTPAPKILMDFILQVEDLHDAPELIALAVNVTSNAKCAEIMCEHVVSGPKRERGFDALVRRGIRLRDPLAFKVIRNVARASDDARRNFTPYVVDLIRLMKEEEPGSDLMVEVLGTLANLNCDALDITETCQEHGLLEYAAILLSPGEVDDDVALEAVMFVGSIVCEFNAQHVVDCGLVERMYTLMSDKKEDDEFVLQIAHAFGAMLRCEATRERLLRGTQVVHYLVDLLQDTNVEVRKCADSALDAVMDYEEDWAVKIRRLKFESHNREWLDATRDGPGDGDVDGPDGYRYDPYHEGPGGGGYRDDEYGDYPDEYRESPADMGMYSPGTVLDNPQEYYGEEEEEVHPNGVGYGGYRRENEYY